MIVVLRCVVMRFVVLIVSILLFGNCLSVVVLVICWLCLLGVVCSVCICLVILLVNLWVVLIILLSCRCRLWKFGFIRF